MKNNDDKKWLESILSRYVYRQPKKFDFQRWIQNHPEEAKLLNDGFENSRKEEKISITQIWRFIMESKVTRYSAVAVVALAIVLVLFNPFGSSKYGGIVLAQVQQKLAESNTMIITGTKTYTRPDKPNEVFEFAGIKWDLDIEKYLSKEYGLVEEGYIDGELVYRLTFNKPQRKSLLVLPVFKKYLAFNSPDDQIRLMENLTPEGLVNMLTDLGHKELGRDNIKGIEVEGFGFEGSEAFKNIFPKFFFDIQSYKGKIWVGIEEQLPISCEGDLFIGKSLMTGFNELILHEVNFIEQYDANIDESVFDISIPEGYTELTISDVLSIVPTSVKTGVVGAGLGVILVPAGFFTFRKRKKREMLQMQK